MVLGEKIEMDRSKDYPWNECHSPDLIRQFISSDRGRKYEGEDGRTGGKDQQWAHVSESLYSTIYS